jgi:hypothetical protein
LNEDLEKKLLYKDSHSEDSTNIDVEFEYDTSEMWDMFGAVVLSRFVSEHFKGTIDEVGIWNVAHSQDQVRKNMNRSLRGSEFGLVGCWNFDKDEGDIIKNGTAYLNNGIAGKLLWDI